MNKLNNKILLIGPLPPPFGGVSIHIKRLSVILNNIFEVDFIDESSILKEEYFNIRSLNIIKYFKKILRSNLLYVHSGKRFLKYFHILVGIIFFKKIILTIHSYRVPRRLILKFSDELFFRLANLIVVVNPDILKSLSLPVKRTTVIQPFIPPIMDDESPLPVDVANWILESRKNDRVIICANAWQLAIYKDEDMYGLDLCIDAVNDLLQMNIPVSFIFIVSSLEKSSDMYLKYKALIEKLKISDKFLLLNEKISFVKLIESSDVVLRPTNTDGDALTIREAIFLGKPIIASDVSRRPEGTIIFKNRDIIDLKNKILSVIESMHKTNPNTANGNIQEYQMVYSFIINNALKR